MNPPNAMIVDPSYELSTRLPSEADIWRQVAERVKAFEVVDQSTLDQMTGWVRQVKAFWRERNNERLESVRDLNAVLKRVNGMYAPILDAFTEIERVGKRKIADYQMKVETERRATMVISASELATGSIPTHVIEPPAQAKGVTVVAKWGFEVMDPDLVPRELCTPDDKKIRAAIAYADTDTPPREIPGIRFFRDDTVRVSK